MLLLLKKIRIKKQIHVYMASKRIHFLSVQRKKKFECYGCVILYIQDTHIDILDIGWANFFFYYDYFYYDNMTLYSVICYGRNFFFHSHLNEKENLLFIHI